MGNAQSPYYGDASSSYGCCFATSCGDYDLGLSSERRTVDWSTSYKGTQADDNESYSYAESSQYLIDRKLQQQIPVFNPSDRQPCGHDSSNSVLRNGGHRSISSDSGMSGGTGREARCEQTILRMSSTSVREEAENDTTLDEATASTTDKTTSVREE